GGRVHADAFLAHAHSLRPALRHRNAGYGDGNHASLPSHARRLADASSSKGVNRIHTLSYTALMNSYALPLTHLPKPLRASGDSRRVKCWQVMQWTVMPRTSRSADDDAGIPNPLALPARTWI